MDIKINPKIIKELCGAVSYKRGEAFYRANKVEIIVWEDNKCEAVVKGTEEFTVQIEKLAAGDFRTTCSCPKLASVKNECQHVAAVLLAIHHLKQQPALHNNEAPTGIAGDLLTIFQQQHRHSSGPKLHFENRTEVQVEFRLSLLDHEEQNKLIAISMTMNEMKLPRIRQFLKRVQEDRPYQLPAGFLYDPLQHYFDKAADLVIKQLISISADEKMYFHSISREEDSLLIPPSSWALLAHLLENIMLVKRGGLQLEKAKLPLQFNFTESDSKSYVLRVEGLDKMQILADYGVVVHEGRLFRLAAEDCRRLFELKQLLVSSGTDEILLPHERISFFVEKVVPGLKRLGEVSIDGDMTKEFNQTPLVAKLYLDRVNNVLLAGLEFHYENSVLDPFNGKNTIRNPLLIRDLDKEATIQELLEEAAFAKTDGGYYLHNEELEYEFLYHVLPKLKHLVQIYATTAVRNRIFREKSGPQIRVKMKKERTNWLEFKFEMDGIPEDQIREVLASLEEKRKYYRLRDGSLLSLETKEFEEIQRFLQAGPIQPEDLENGLDMPILHGLKLLESAGNDVLKLEASFNEFMQELSDPLSEKFALPPELSAIMRSYQKQGFQWLKTLAGYGFGGILADEMGLGKTLQSIAFIQSELPAIRERKQPVLIVCPSSLTYNWLSELMKFSPGIQALIVDGKRNEREQLLHSLGEVDLIITSYMLLRRDVHLYEKIRFHTVFYDEAQYFKNPATQTAKAVMRIKADHRFALTGTPVENSREELWSIFRVVFPELFRGLKEFSNLPRKTIARRISPFMLRRVKEDVLEELPEKMEFTHTVELLPEQKTLYAAYLAKLRHKTFKKLDKDTIRKNRIKILSGLTRLRQICCHPALFVDNYQGSSAKFEQLMQIVEESRSAGRRVLIFSQFTKMLSLIGKEFTSRNLPFFYLDGLTPSGERIETCNRFNEGERDFFLISLKAGGTGLNLTGADTVILYDLWWNPAVEAQAAGRAHRMGQKKTVQVIKLIARGTIEEKMDELQDRKRVMISEIIDRDDGAAAFLTEEDIREILMM